AGGLEMIIQRLGDPERIPVAGEIDMGDLPQCMNARIGAPGGLGAHLLAGKGENGLLQNLLDRVAVGLALPADKSGSVILDGELVAGHGYPSTVPVKSPAPRRKAVASMAALPSRCTSSKRTAPSPHATVSPSSPLPRA